MPQLELEVGSTFGGVEKTTNGYFFLSHSLSLPPFPFLKSIFKNIKNKKPTTTKITLSYQGKSSFNLRDLSYHLRSCAIKALPIIIKELILVSIDTYAYCYSKNKLDGNKFDLYTILTHFPSQKAYSSF